MKITKKQLRRIIGEEYSKLLKEAGKGDKRFDDHPAGYHPLQDRLSGKSIGSWEVLEDIHTEDGWISAGRSGSLWIDTDDNTQYILRHKQYRRDYSAGFKYAYYLITGEEYEQYTQDGSLDVW